LVALLAESVAVKINGMQKKRNFPFHLEHASPRLSDNIINNNNNNIINNRFYFYL